MIDMNNVIASPFIIVFQEEVKSFNSKILFKDLKIFFTERFENSNFLELSGKEKVLLQFENIKILFQTLINQLNKFKEKLNIF